MRARYGKAVCGAACLHGMDIRLRFRVHTREMTAPSRIQLTYTAVAIAEESFKSRRCAPPRNAPDQRMKTFDGELLSSRR